MIIRLWTGRKEHTDVEVILESANKRNEFRRCVEQIKIQHPSLFAKSQSITVVPELTIEENNMRQGIYRN